jgi:hypothetical protein
MRVSGGFGESLHSVGVSLCKHRMREKRESLSSFVKRATAMSKYYFVGAALTGAAAAGF